MNNRSYFHGFRESTDALHRFASLGPRRSAGLTCFNGRTRADSRWASFRCNGQSGYRDVLGLLDTVRIDALLEHRSHRIRRASVLVVGFEHVRPRLCHLDSYLEPGDVPVPQRNGESIFGPPDIRSTGIMTTGGENSPSTLASKTIFGHGPNPFEFFGPHAAVFYEANNTALVGFPALGDGPLTGDFSSFAIRFSVSNVLGSIGGAGGCK
jgi:hypothetical protein